MTHPQTVEQALDLVPEAGPAAPPPRLQRFQWLGILSEASRLTRTRIVTAAIASLRCSPADSRTATRAASNWCQVLT